MSETKATSETAPATKAEKPFVYDHAISGPDYEALSPEHKALWEAEWWRRVSGQGRISRDNAKDDADYRRELRG